MTRHLGKRAGLPPLWAAPAVLLGWLAACSTEQPHQSARSSAAPAAGQSGAPGGSTTSDGQRARPGPLHEQTVAKLRERAGQAGELEDELAFVASAVDQGQPPPADAYVALGQELLKAQRPAVARLVLIEGERAHPDDARLLPLIERAIDDDPRYRPEPRVIELDRGITAIKYLGGGSTITLRFMANQRTVGAFKPHQTRTQSDFLAEIAAWRLCPLIRCSFYVPYNEHVKLSRETFDELYGRIEEPSQVRYRNENFADLRFVRADDGTEWLHGALETWVHDFTLLPIERVQIWRPWLAAAGPDAAALRELDARAIDSFDWRDTRRSPKHFRLLARHMGAITRRHLARQLSDMLVFDFLTTNWDRFSEKDEYWGANCQFKAGTIVSIDNGAAFWPEAHPVVRERLELTQRFRRQLVRAVRRLDKKRTFRRLFQHRSRQAAERFLRFWRQREAFLAYVDGLVAEHGEAAVLCLD